MHINNFFFMLVMTGIVWNIVTVIGIHNKLEYNHILQNMTIMRYAPWIRLAEYKKTTEMETGEIGSLYYQYILSILLTGISVGILIIRLITG